MKTKANILPSLTWRFTESNSKTVDLEDFDIEIKNRNLVNLVPSEFREHFDELKYGVSKEILEINEKNRNYEDFYVLESDEHIEKFFVLDGDNKNLYDLHGIEVKENSDATILLDYMSSENYESFRNTLIKIKSEKNSKLKIIVLQRLSSSSESILSMVTDLEENASVDLVHIEIGSKNSYSNYLVNIKGNQAHSDIKTAYFVDENRYLDLAYEITHKGEKTSSDMVINGVLKDYAKKRFSGTLDFKKGSTLSTGNEEEFVTLLDPTVKNWAVPILLAREDNIVGNHAASAGHVDNDMLFYIKTRGFNELEAKKIIVESKIRPVLDLIENEKIEEEIMSQILESIE